MRGKSAAAADVRPAFLYKKCGFSYHEESKRATKKAEILKKTAIVENVLRNYDNNTSSQMHIRVNVQKFRPMFRQIVLGLVEFVG